jgi:hypothetical protein
MEDGTPHQRNIEHSIIIEDNTKGVPTGSTSQNGVIAIADPEYHLAIRTDSSWRRPVSPRVRKRCLKENGELGFILDNTFHPAEFVRQFHRRRRYYLISDLAVELAVYHERPN